MDTPSPATPGAPLHLKIRGCGQVANFKNSKMVVKRGLITDPELKARMQRIQHALECALLSVLRTGDAAISTDVRRQFLMRSLPHDDCWTCISELILTGELVEPGEEGFDLTIERI